MIDFHSHILPEMDDGAKDIEESLALLLSLREQGVTTVVATPHYRGRCSIKRFLKDRQKSYDKLKAAMDATGEQYPEIILGAEVAVSGYILQHHGLDRLCIEGTNYLLAEMPDKHWAPYLYHVIYTLSAQYRLNVIIAHVDRYFTSFGRNNKILKLIEMQPIFQINTSSLMLGKGKKLLKWLDSFGVNIILGTDCHNTTNRLPHYSKPAQYIIKKYGQEYFDGIDSFGKNLLVDK